MTPASLVVRLVGLWILVGGCLKMLLGSPAELPAVLRDLPVPTATVFALALAIELGVGVLALARPSRGWLPAAALLLVFLGVLGTQVAAGASSCGCFGADVTIDPVVMLVIDGLALLVLLASRPWRLEAGRLELPWLATALAVLLAVGVPWTLDRETTTAELVTGTSKGPRWVETHWESWTGKPLDQTQLWPLLKPNARIQEGLIVLWSPVCEVCAEHLMLLASTQQGQQPVILLELPVEFEDEKRVVKILPEGAWVTRDKLPPASYVDVTPPLHVEVSGGRVTKVVQGTDVLE